MKAGNTRTSARVRALAALAAVGLLAVLWHVHADLGAPDRPALRITGPAVAASAGAALAVRAPSAPIALPDVDAAVAASSSPQGRSPLPAGMLSRSPEDWFRQALSPTTSVRDRIVAAYLTGMCAQAKGADDTLAEQAKWSPEAVPASAPDVGISEWQGLRKLVGVSPERVREIRQLQAYCGNALDFNYPVKARKLPTRAYEYADLIVASQPASRRIPLITTVLSSPLAHDLEVRLWAEHELRDILERRDGLTMLQAWHAVGWWLQQVLGDSEQVRLYWQERCAWLGLCRSVGLLSEEDQRRAEQVAARALTDLQRQDWPRLIYTPRQ